MHAPNKRVASHNFPMDAPQSWELKRSDNHARCCYFPNPYLDLRQMLTQLRQRCPAIPVSIPIISMKIFGLLRVEAIGWRPGI